MAFAFENGHVRWKNSTWLIIDPRMLLVCLAGCVLRSGSNVLSDCRGWPLQTDVIDDDDAALPYICTPLDMAISLTYDNCGITRCILS